MNKIQNQFRIFSNISKMQRIFVYGTLKKGQPNHKFIADAENGSCTFIGTGRTVDKWPLVIASKYNIPFLLDNKGHGKNVLGEIYEVDSKMAAFLDEFEDCPKWYQRDPITVELLNEPENSVSIKDQAMEVESEVNKITGTSTQECIVYKLKAFKDELLKLPTIMDYDGFTEPVYDSKADNEIPYGIYNNYDPIGDTVDSEKLKKLGIV